MEGDKSLNFMVGFVGGSFLSFMLVTSYPIFGSIAMGLIIGALLTDSNKKERKVGVKGK